MSSTVRIGLMADFNPAFPPHRVVNEVLQHVAQSLGVQIEDCWLPTESLAEKDSETALAQFDALWCAPGSPYKSLRGALNGIRFARERDYPFIGTCGGFQHTVLEYARNVLGYEDADSEEHDPSAGKLFITPLSCFLAGKTFQVKVRRDTRAYQIYEKEEITEHYYCQFGLNPEFHDEIERGGLSISGIDETAEARIIELPHHRFFIATLFVPQLFSGVSEPHALIVAFVKAALVFQREKHLSALS